MKLISSRFARALNYHTLFLPPHCTGSFEFTRLNSRLKQEESRMFHATTPSSYFTTFNSNRNVLKHTEYNKRNNVKFRTFSHLYKSIFTKNNPITRRISLHENILLATGTMFHHNVHDVALESEEFGRWSTIIGKATQEWGKREQRSFSCGEFVTEHVLLHQRVEAVGVENCISARGGNLLQRISHSFPKERVHYNTPYLMNVGVLLKLLLLKR